MKASAAPVVGGFNNFDGQPSQGPGGGRDGNRQGEQQSHRPAPAVNIAAASQEPCPTFKHIDEMRLQPRNVVCSSPVPCVCACESQAF